jgi:hypothetical protein
VADAVWQNFIAAETVHQKLNSERAKQPTAVLIQLKTERMQMTARVSSFTLTRYASSYYIVLLSMYPCSQKGPPAALANTNDALHISVCHCASYEKRHFSKNLEWKTTGTARQMTRAFVVMHIRRAPCQRDAAYLEKSNAINPLPDAVSLFAFVSVRVRQLDRSVGSAYEWALPAIEDGVTVCWTHRATLIVYFMRGKERGRGK